MSFSLRRVVDKAFLSKRNLRSLNDLKISEGLEDFIGFVSFDLWKTISILSVDCPWVNLKKIFKHPAESYRLTEPKQRAHSPPASKGLQSYSIGIDQLICPDKKFSDMTFSKTVIFTSEQSFVQTNPGHQNGRGQQARWHGAPLAHATYIRNTHRKKQEGLYPMRTFVNPFIVENAFGSPIFMG